MRRSNVFVAYHEAGHAVVAVALGYSDYIVNLSIESNVGDSHKGCLKIAPKEAIDFSEDDDESRAAERGFIRHTMCYSIMLLAGAVAELEARRDSGMTLKKAAVYAADCSTDDRDKASDYLAQINCLKHKTRIHWLALDLVYRNWARIAAVAEVLMEVGTLSGAGLLEVCL